MKGREDVLELLKELKIEYSCIDHEPVYTVEEAQSLSKLVPAGFKNLFLKDKASDRYYIAIMPEHKRADLKSMMKQLGAKRLSFANEEELYEILGLRPGSVTPFGLMNDTDNKVTVLLDEEMDTMEKVTFHPNVNTSTLILDRNDFDKYLDWTKHKVEKIII